MSTNPNSSVSTDTQRAEENLYRDLSPEHREAMRQAVEAGRKEYLTAIREQTGFQISADRGVSTEDRTREVLQPASQLSNQEILRETCDLHAHFQQLSDRFEQAPPSQRAEIRQEMEPLVNREKELRQEYSGRQGPEISQDRVPEMVSFRRLFANDRALFTNDPGDKHANLNKNKGPATLIVIHS